MLYFRRPNGRIRCWSVSYGLLHCTSFPWRALDRALFIRISCGCSTPLFRGMLTRSLLQGPGRRKRYSSLQQHCWSFGASSISSGIPGSVQCHTPFLSRANSVLCQSMSPATPRSAFLTLFLPPPTQPVFSCPLYPFSLSSRSPDPPPPLPLASQSSRIKPSGS